MSTKGYLMNERSYFINWFNINPFKMYSKSYFGCLLWFGQERCKVKYYNKAQVLWFNHFGISLRGYYSQKRWNLHPRSLWSQLSLIKTKLTNENQSEDMRFNIKITPDVEQSNTVKSKAQGLRDEKYDKNAWLHFINSL